MKESCKKGVANHPDPESCVAGRKAAIEALTRHMRAERLAQALRKLGYNVMLTAITPEPAAERQE